MRVAIINITGGGISGGYKKYLLNIIPHLAANSDIQSLLCVSSNTLRVETWFKPMRNVEFANFSSYNFFGYGFSRKLKQKINQFSPDLIFSPVERPFKFNNIPVVIMIQNMEPLAYVNKGNPLSEKVKNWFRHCYARQAVKKANRIIAISEFVKEYLIKKWHVSEDKIGLVYHGIDNLKRNNSIKPLQLPAGWERRFIFTAGSIRPARGLKDILEAMHYLDAEANEIVKLVIAGDAAPNMLAYQNKLKRLIKRLGIIDRVCWMNQLDNDEMAWCYKNCKLFVMSSRVESFGQIALEAMSHGCICVSADNPCLPEIFKDTAVYYQPKNSRSLTKAIKNIFSWDFAKREKMAQLARSRASDFSWDVCAKKTVEELIKAYKS